MLTFEKKTYLHYLIYTMTLAVFFGKTFKVLAGLIVIFFLYEKWKEKDFSFFNNKIFIILASWCSYLALSAFWADQPIISILGSLELFLWVMTLLAISNILVLREDIERFIKVQALIILFICGNSYFQYIVGFNFFGTPLRGGTFITDLLSADKVTPYILPLWISLFGTILVMNEYSKKYHILYSVIIFLLLLIIPLSGARGAIIILAIFLPLIAWLSPYRKVAFGALAALLSIILILIFTNDALAKRLKTLKNPFENQRQIRVSIWLTGLEMFYDNKLLGVGFKNFENNTLKYYKDSFDSIIIIPESGKTTSHAHNPWIDVLAEQGLIGISFLLFLLFSVAEVMYKNKLKVLVASLGIWYSFSLLNSNFILSSGVSSFFMILSITFFLIINNYVLDKRLK